MYWSDERRKTHHKIEHYYFNFSPIWHGINDDHAACWMLEGGDDTPDAISSILSEGLTDIEIGEILKTSDFHFQGNRYRVRIQFPENDERIVFRESRVFARHLCEKRVPPSSFLRLSEEKFECTISKESNHYNCKIGYNWRYGLFWTPSKVIKGYGCSTCFRVCGGSL